jgi:hypothetical protein
MTNFNPTSRSSYIYEPSTTAKHSSPLYEFSTQNKSSIYEKSSHTSTANPLQSLQRIKQQLNTNSTDSSDSANSIIYQKAREIFNQFEYSHNKRFKSAVRNFAATLGFSSAIRSKEQARAIKQVYRDILSTKINNNAKIRESLIERIDNLREKYTVLKQEKNRLFSQYHAVIMNTSTNTLSEAGKSAVVQRNNALFQHIQKWESIFNDMEKDVRSCENQLTSYNNHMLFNFDTTDTINRLEQGLNYQPNHFDNLKIQLQQLEFKIPQWNNEADSIQATNSIVESLINNSQSCTKKFAETTVLFRKHLENYTDHNEQFQRKLGPHISILNNSYKNAVNQFKEIDNFWNGIGHQLSTNIWSRAQDVSLWNTKLEEMQKSSAISKFQRACDTYTEVYTNIRNKSSNRPSGADGANRTQPNNAPRPNGAAGPNAANRANNHLQLRKLNNTKHTFLSTTIDGNPLIPANEIEATSFVKCRQIYLKTARAVHPDKDKKNPKATANFQQLNKAWENFATMLKLHLGNELQEGSAVEVQNLKLIDEKMQS